MLKTPSIQGNSFFLIISGKCFAFLLSSPPWLHSKHSFFSALYIWVRVKLFRSVYAWLFFRVCIQLAKATQGWWKTFPCFSPLFLLSPRCICRGNFLKKKKNFLICKHIFVFNSTAETHTPKWKHNSFHSTIRKKISLAKVFVDSRENLFFIKRERILMIFKQNFTQKLG